MEWPEILELAFAKCNISPEVFWNLSWYEFDMMVQGANYMQELEWQRTREIVGILYNINAKKGRSKKSSELYPLNLDKKRPVNVDRKKVDAMAKRRFPEWFDPITGVLLKAPRKV